ncbi:MAG: DegV family protein [Chloroflexi bacterium]|nr:DegV family protein [Chloroflexota bacterium]
MSERYAIVVDGTAAMPDEVSRENNILVLPLHVSFGAETFTEGVDITTKEFYARQAQPGARATTSQPSLGDCRDAYDSAIRDGAKAMLVLTVATELSGTFSVAKTAAEQLSGVRAEVVDCRSLAGSIALVGTACARARRDGASFEETVALARKLAGRVKLFAIIDTLEHLRRSGRASGLQAMFGSLLAVKPILDVHDGVLDPIDKVRTRDKAVARLKQLIEERLAPGERVHFCTLHTNDPERAGDLGRWAQERFHCVEYYSSEAGAVIAAHAGPGVLGACWYPESMLKS